MSRSGAVLTITVSAGMLAVAVRATAQEPAPVPESPSPPAPATHRGLDALEWAQRAREHRRQRDLARARAARYQRRLARARLSFRRALTTSPVGAHWLERAFLCVHRYEGPWGAATGNGYYGGLQMDLDFQRAYGSVYLRAFGPANRWPRSVQLAVGIRGWMARGFQPWPNTARMCGLL
jgi:Transglycosylase-like domain